MFPGPSDARVQKQVASLDRFIMKIYMSMRTDENLVVFSIISNIKKTEGDDAVRQELEICPHVSGRLDKKMTCDCSD